MKKEKAGWNRFQITQIGSPFSSDQAQSEPRNYLKSPVSPCYLWFHLSTHINVFAPCTYTISAAACSSIRLCANESSRSLQRRASKKSSVIFHLLIFTRPKQTGCTDALYICRAATINALVELLRQSFYSVYDLPTPLSFRGTQQSACSPVLEFSNLLA